MSSSSADHAQSHTAVPSLAIIPADAGARGPIVLIAERDQTVRELQRFFLAREGFGVEFVGDGEAALERARAVRPAVIVTEILIPKIDGLTLCRLLSEDETTRHIPVVVFSILSAESRARVAGAKAFLRKPLVESVFIATIREQYAALKSAGMEAQ